MSQDSLNKIKRAEQNAQELIAKAKKDAEQNVIMEKNKWDQELQSVKEDYADKLFQSIKLAEKEAADIKLKRKREIEANIKEIEKNSGNKIREIVDFVVEKFIARYK